MEADFPVKVDGKRKKVDIAIFEAGKKYLPENISVALQLPALSEVGKKSVSEDPRFRTGGEGPG